MNCDCHYFEVAQRKRIKKDAIFFTCANKFKVLNSPLTPSNSSLYGKAHINMVLLIFRSSSRK